MEEQVKSSMTVVKALAAAQMEGNAICSFDSTAVHNTPEAPKYMQAVLKTLMKCACMVAAPEPPAQSS